VPAGLGECGGPTVGDNTILLTASVVHYRPNVMHRFATTASVLVLLLLAPSPAAQAAIAAYRAQLGANARPAQVARRRHGRAAAHADSRIGSGSACGHPGCGRAHGDSALRKLEAFGPQLGAPHTSAIRGEAHTGRGVTSSLRLDQPAFVTGDADQCFGRLAFSSPIQNTSPHPHPRLSPLGVTFCSRLISSLPNSG
jgi:hypothetical protein